MEDGVGDRQSRVRKVSHKTGNGASKGEMIAWKDTVPIKRRRTWRLEEVTCLSLLPFKGQQHIKGSMNSPEEGIQWYGAIVMVSQPKLPLILSTCIQTTHGNYQSKQLQTLECVYRISQYNVSIWLSSWLNLYTLSVVTCRVIFFSLILNPHIKTSRVKYSIISFFLNWDIIDIMFFFNSELCNINLG